MDAVVQDSRLPLLIIQITSCPSAHDCCCSPDKVALTPRGGFGPRSTVKPNAFLFPREDDAAACLTARMRVVFEGARRARRASAYRALTFCEQGENLPSSRRQHMGKAFLQRRRPPAILADCVLTPRRFHETIVMFLMQQLGPCTERWF